MTTFCATPDQMVQKLRLHPELLRRYSIAWNLSNKQVLERISYLHMGYMPTDGYANVHYWRNSGDRFRHDYLEHVGDNVKKEKIKAGTCVFFDVTGHPFIIRTCGNPVSVFRPAPAPQVARLGNAASPELPPSPLASAEDIMDNVPQQLASSTSDVLTPLSQPSSLIEGGASSAVGGPIVFAGPGTGTIASALHSGGALLGASTLGLITIRHLGGGGGTTPTQLILAPVPEPSLPTFVLSMLAFLSGALFLGRRNRSRQAATR